MEVFVGSTTSRLRSVIVCAPNLAHQRLTPANCQQHLFEEPIWVERAQEEHATFCNVLKSQNVEVLEFRDLLTQTLNDRKAQKFVFDRFFGREQNLESETLSEWFSGLSSAQMATYLMGGVTVADLADLQSKLNYFQRRADDFLFEPLPNLLFMRDASSWIYGGFSLNPMFFSERKAETTLLEAMYRFHPRFSNSKCIFQDTKHSNMCLEGGDIMPLSNGVLLIGCGERSNFLAVANLAANLPFCKQIVVAKMPKLRAAMHLDTVFSFVNDHTVSIYPEIVNQMECFSVFPAEDRPRFHPEAKGLIPVLEKALERSIQVISTGGNAFEAANEQFNDANNLLVIEPNLVIAYERNRKSNDVLRQHHVEVLTIPGSELGRGRGGPHCLTSTIKRD
jgi:arginine deiminase